MWFWIEKPLIILGDDRGLHGWLCDGYTGLCHLMNRITTELQFTLN